MNLTPIAGLERHLHRRRGDARLALRAVREAVLERNRGGGSAGRLGDGPRPCPAAGAIQTSSSARRTTPNRKGPAAPPGNRRRPTAAPKLTQAALSDPGD